MKVIVMPKAAVLDPQGNAVRDAMRHLGMPEVRSVRIGKYMEIDVDGKNGELEARLHGLCRDLLSCCAELKRLFTLLSCPLAARAIAEVLHRSAQRRLGLRRAPAPRPLPWLRRALPVAASLER